MKIFKTKEQFSKAVGTFLIVAAAILFAVLVYKFSDVWALCKKILRIFTPFYIGIAIAFILNPVIKGFENSIFKKIDRAKTRRLFAVILTYIAFTAAMILFFYVIIPNLIDSVTSLINSIPANVNHLMKMLNGFFDQHPSLQTLYADNSDKIAGYLGNAVKYIASEVGKLLPSVVTMTVSITGVLTNVFIGIVISVYMVLQKEKLLAQTKQVIYAVAAENRAEKIIGIGKITNQKMSGYFASRLAIAAINAVLVYLFCLIARIPYAVLLSVIVGLFSIIPFFGATIGCVIGVVILVIQSPLKALYFLIFNIIVQQVGGNVYGPKIEGKQLQINAFWIIFAILLFGGIFGFWGLLIGVPIFSVIYTFIAEWVRSRLTQKGLSVNTEDYIDQ